MAHINPDFKTKAEFKQAVKDGKRVVLVAAGPIPLTKNAMQYVEAPAEYHKWYAAVEARERDGEMIVVKVVS